MALEDQVDSNLFGQVLDQVRYRQVTNQTLQVQQKCEFPKRMDWTGQERDMSYDELKVNYAQVDHKYLSRALQSSV